MSLGYSVTHWTDGWTIEPPFNYEVGKTYIVRVTHTSGVWADFLITVIAILPDGEYEFTFDTVLDGSPGFMDGYIETKKKS